MRIVIDMQGAQAANCFNGIGSYTMAFTQAILRHRGEHEVILTLSGLFPETVEPIRIAFRELLPQENIKVCYVPNNVSYLNGNEERRRIAELTREAFLSSLNPDIVLISSLFEGLVDDAVTSISSFNPDLPTAVILYDKVLFTPHEYSETPVANAWYESKIKYLRNANILLATSESCYQESINHLGITENDTVNISNITDWQEEGDFQQENASLLDEASITAIATLEHFYLQKNVNKKNKPEHKEKSKLAYISPLPPERSGISDYSAELLPELAKHYQVDVIIKSDAVSDPWIQAHCDIYSAEWFKENHQHYDRVLYHFGNSPFHEHMFELLEKIPGVVVLHDFYLSGIYGYMEAHGGQNDAFRKALYYSHGYQALEEYFRHPDTPDVVWAYPCSLSVIQNSLGMIAHSRNSLRLAKQWYGSKEKDWAIIPLLRSSKDDCSKEDTRKVLGYRETDFIVCAFGALGPTKLNQSLLKAWLNSSLADDKSCHLIFVGENPSTNHENELVNRIKNSGCEQNIHITGWLDADSFRQYLTVADLSVQLRTLSRGETSAAVLDCMNYSLATIVNANGAMADLDSYSVWMLPDNFSEAELTDALDTLRHDSVRRKTLGEKAKEIILRYHSPEVCATMYYDAIEHFYVVAGNSLAGLMKTFVASEYLSNSDESIAEMAKILHHNFLPVSVPKQLFIDVSALVHEDLKTGIQRVVRSILVQLLKSPPNGYRVEPVYSVLGQPYRYAQRFTQELLEVQLNQQDDVVDFSLSDILLVLDFHITANLHKKDFYHKIRGDGVNVYFVVYDLLSTLTPHFFPNGQQAKILFDEWLEIVAENNGAVCISKSVANELNHFLELHKIKKHPLFQSSWFHLGADIENSVATQGLPKGAEQMLSMLQETSSFLMVGTLEPRKGHTQTLDAFEKLWSLGYSPILVIVGKQGWMVEGLIERIRSHNELNKRLFWLEVISDEYLEQVYKNASCLIAASYGEGFGLPLIEAAQYKLPIIARDIPVFREVAGEYAYYFDGTTTEEFTSKIQDWGDLYKRDKHPKSDNMPWLTWEESAKQLMDLIIK